MWKHFTANQAKSAFHLYLNEAPEMHEIPTVIRRIIRKYCIDFHHLTKKYIHITKAHQFSYPFYFLNFRKPDQHVKNLTPQLDVSK